MKNLALLSAVALLSACASLIDGQTDHVTFLTPGAENAKCHIENQDFKYVAYTGQTIEMNRSPYDFTVNCLADGNRDQTILVKRELNDWVFLNVANGFVPGAAYDFVSRSAFDLPETITVSFSSTKKPYDLPDYQQGIAQNNLEYMGPNELMTEGNRFDVSKAPQKKEAFRAQQRDQLDNILSAAPPSVRDSGVSRFDPKAGYDPFEDGR